MSPLDGIPLPKPGEPCVYCDKVAGDWNQPCEGAPDRLHVTVACIRWIAQERTRAVAQSLRRACLELEQVADEIDELPARMRRRLRLDADLVRNEAERGRDTLHVYGLLDV